MPGLTGISQIVPLDGQNHLNPLVAVQNSSAVPFRSIRQNMLRVTHLPNFQFRSLAEMTAVTSRFSPVLARFFFCNLLSIFGLLPPIANMVLAEDYMRYISALRVTVPN